MQGALELLWELEHAMAEVTGMDRVTFQPAAGAHGELTSLLMISKYFEEKGERRSTVVVPDSAHGTNPASATFAGLQGRRGEERPPRQHRPARRSRPC